MSAIPSERLRAGRGGTRAALLVAVMVIGLASCGSAEGGETADATSPTTSNADSVAFSETVLPIIEGTCARCHTGDGPGTAHLRFDTVADVVSNTLDIAAIVGTRTMPPWPASDHSVEFKDNLSLSQAEIDAILEWHATGSELDIDPTTEIESDNPVVGLRDADEEVFAQGAYDGQVGQPDEYRCFVYDPAVEGDTYISGYEFVPDQTEVVHHLIGYIIDGSLRADADLKSGEDGQDGWSCFGSSGLGADEIFVGWAPGQAPTEFPAGTGMLLRDGDFMVLQIHYHYEVDAPADFSSLKLRYADGDVSPIDLIEFLAPAEIPCLASEVGPLCDRQAAMDAAVAKYGHAGVRADQILGLCDAAVEDFSTMTDGIATSRCELPARATGTIHSVLGHMHEVGLSFKMTLNPGTADEVILLDIPDWDFDWQLNYEPVDAIAISANDTISIECSWDRSRRDANLEPAYILWADGTDDEMCFATMMVY